MRKKGFTLIEVVVAVSIVIILASLTVPKISGYIEKTKNAKVISMAKQVYTAAMWSYSEQGSSFNASSILDTINAVSGVQGINGDSVSVVNSKNAVVAIMSDNTTYYVKINADTNGYLVTKDDKTIFNSAQ